MSTQVDTINITRKINRKNREIKRSRK